MGRSRLYRISASTIKILVAVLMVTIAGVQDDDNTVAPRPSVTPDISDADLPAAVHNGNLVTVPIPFSNPTLESGLVGLAAYFYPQTDAQEAIQPPSVTGLAAMYTVNKSWGVALGKRT